MILPFVSRSQVPLLFLFLGSCCIHRTSAFCSTPSPAPRNQCTVLFSKAEEDGIRLNKVFKASHSRREADDLIESGRVSVNGQPVHGKGGFKVIPFVDQVALDGIPIQGWEAMNGISTNKKQNAATPKKDPKKKSPPISSSTRNFEYIKYYKPRGVTCTTDRSIKNNIIDDLIQKRGFQPKHRVYPVGRLDKDTSGLILLTSDGRLPNSALRGQFKQPKIYQVFVDKPLHPKDVQKLRDGVVITTVAQREGGGKALTAPTLPCRVERMSSSPRGVTMTLVEGRNRQIRKMMQALGYEVVELHRIQFMGITLDPLTKAGEWVHLKNFEMKIVQDVLERAGSAAV